MSNEEFSVKFMGLIVNIGYLLLFRISFFMGENNIVSVYIAERNGIFFRNIKKKTEICGCGSE
ncbi:hypothetical protein AKG16_14970 [Morganella morganii]|nr:hypothetical protein AKG16_14970 [Morganella morganii]